MDPCVARTARAAELYPCVARTRAGTAPATSPVANASALWGTSTLACTMYLGMTSGAPDLPELSVTVHQSSV